MKTLGLGVAGIGTAAAAIPVFHDLDEIAGAPKGRPNRPWWVKEVDDPTLEVDWNALERFTPSRGGQDTYLKDYDGWNAKLAEVSAAHRGESKQAMLDNTPGRTLRDSALCGATWQVAIDGMYHFLPHPYQATPTSRGVPRWEGTPEENAQMIRVASRYFGAQDVGFLRTDGRNRKLFWALTSSIFGKRPIVFEDVDQGSLGDNMVIPNKAQWIIVLIIPQSADISKRFTGAPSLAYEMAQRTMFRMQQFLVGLGYLGLGGDVSGIGSAPGAGVMCGASELGRNNIQVTPETGSAVRTAMWVITDLPVAVTKPIDFGARRFCLDCRACQRGCPGSAFDDEREPSWGQDKVEGPWRWVGAKRWRYHQKECSIGNTLNMGCTQCQGTCVFNKKDLASVHEVTKAVLATTPIFNSFFASMDEAFGYGMYDDPESFWEIENYPLFGLH